MKIQSMNRKEFLFRRGRKAKTVRLYGELQRTKYQQKFGGVAQLGEHLPCKQGVRSSILLISIRLLKEVNDMYLEN